MRSTENLDRVGLAVDEPGPVSVTEEIENLPAYKLQESKCIFILT